MNSEDVSTVYRNFVVTQPPSLCYELHTNYVLMIHHQPIHSSVITALCHCLLSNTKSYKQKKCIYTVLSIYIVADEKQCFYLFTWIQITI